ncbi:MAG: TAXI family TRAP transporter solute-binding subunit [Pseudodesulfovibrio sp.]|nr:TAXI family TRAP transporter solute-binding subunit [Pseudodesulfovibrio sp.]
MNHRLNLTLTIVLGLFFVVSYGCSSEPENTNESAQTKQVEKTNLFLAFGGGPTGGTFNFFANKMSSIISNDYTWLDVSPKGSGGSAENLRTLDKNAIDIGIVYSGDAFLGRNAQLPDDPTRYDKVLALSFLYGAPAQLVVRKDSGIESASDLDGKVVAIGNPGSGAALSAERFFKHLGLWDKIKHRNLGYSQAATDFSDRRIDAFWVLVGYPNSSIIEAAHKTPIKILNLHEDATKSGFYEIYPFYSKVEIPENTYEGQEQAVITFQDAALWCASDIMDENTIYQCMKSVYSEQGLKDMTTAHKAAKDMSISKGINGASIPLHPGAIRFWKEQGLDIPANLLH